MAKKIKKPKKRKSAVKRKNRKRSPRALSAF